MAKDHDAARIDVAEDGAESLRRVRALDAPGVHAVDDELDASDTAESPDLPGAFINEELVVRIVPQAPDEFTCGSCFLVRHRSQRVRETNGVGFCRECEN